jgi:NAD(P)-dependent dehydrogenase (short-subunit alcohol dehydrogenase family)
MTSTVYLVSGANRGIGASAHLVLAYHLGIDHSLLGLGFVTALIRRDNVIVFAGARNPSSATDLQALIKEFPGKAHIVKLTSCDKKENEAAVKEISSIAGRLDVVIANAGTILICLLINIFLNPFFKGISNFYGPSMETPAEQMREHFEVNTKCFYLIRCQCPIFLHPD